MSGFHVKISEKAKQFIKEEGELGVIGINLDGKPSKQENGNMKVSWNSMAGTHYEIEIEASATISYLVRVIREKLDKPGYAIKIVYEEQTTKLIAEETKVAFP